MNVNLTVRSQIAVDANGKISLIVKDELANGSNTVIGGGGSGKEGGN